MTQGEFAERIVAMQDTLYRVSSSILPQLCDREDAVQETIRRAWEKQSRLRDDSLMKAWVVRILINVCYQTYRRRKRELPMETLPEQPVPAGADADLYRFFAALPDKLRLPMTLHYVEGYRLDEIAAMMRLPVGTIKSRLSRGRARMRQDEPVNEFLKEAQGV